MTELEKKADTGDQLDLMEEDLKKITLLLQDLEKELYTIGRTVEHGEQITQSLKLYESMALDYVISLKKRHEEIKKLLY